MLKLLLYTALCILSMAFIADYVHYARIYLGQKEIRETMYYTKALEVNVNNPNDTLTVTIHIDTGCPDKGMLNLVDSNSNTVTIYDHEYPKIERRINGKRYNILIKRLQELKMDEIHLFHTSEIIDSLGFRPSYFGKIKLVVNQN
ncbi:MAG: hypothetical protein N4A46_14885 [Schleiferiaceae bacterium]|nr:hypothetical protein [Schleiferiaceae bacterium]